MAFKLSKIKSIKKVGIEETYDITMKNKTNQNFLANKGIITHNSRVILDMFLNITDTIRVKSVNIIVIGVKASHDILGGYTLATTNKRALRKGDRLKTEVVEFSTWVKSYVENPEGVSRDMGRVYLPAPLDIDVAHYLKAEKIPAVESILQFSGLPGIAQQEFIYDTLVRLKNQGMMPELYEKWKYARKHRLDPGYQDQLKRDMEERQMERLNKDRRAGRAIKI